MLILYAILIASAGLSSLAEGSAIKGYAHARPQEEGRSIKLSPVNNNLEKSAKVPSPVQSQPQAQAPTVPILESTKKIYNDESIRRLVAQQPPNSPPAIIEQSAVAPAVKTVDSLAPVVQKELPLALSVPHQAPVTQEKPASAEPAAPSVLLAQPVQPVVVAHQAPSVEQPAPVVVVKEVPVAVEAKSAAVEPISVKPAGELPPQSERSAPIRNEPALVAQAPVTGEQPVSVVAKIEQPIAAPVVVVLQEQQAPVVVPQPELVAPVVVVKSQSQPEQVQVNDSPLQAKKDETPVSGAVAPVEPLHIEVPVPDPGLVLSEPIDSTTKLLIDLDEHVQKFLPAEDQQQAQPQKDQILVAGVDYSPASAEPTGKSSVPLVPYSSSSADAIVPPLPSLDGVEKASAASPAQPVASSSVAQASGVQSSSGSPSATRQGSQNQNQQQVITQLLDQLDSLQNRIQDTINQLVARRRYVMSALLRPMGTYVRRVRTNLERLQNRVNQLQAAAVSVGGGQNRPGGFVDAAAIETIRRRIDDISKRISDIVNRIRFSLTPTSAPLNSNGRK